MHFTLGNDFSVSVYMEAILKIDLNFKILIQYWYCGMTLFILFIKNSENNYNDTTWGPYQGYTRLDLREKNQLKTYSAINNHIQWIHCWFYISKK